MSGASVGGLSFDFFRVAFVNANLCVRSLMSFVIVAAVARVSGLFFVVVFVGAIFADFAPFAYG